MLCQTAVRFTTTGMIHFSLETLLFPAVMVVSIQLAFIFAELYQLKTKLKSKTAKVDVASLPSDLPSIRLEEVVSVAATPAFLGLFP
jgi:hypothetical protein